jgi:hypothetical protein
MPGIRHAFGSLNIGKILKLYGKFYKLPRFFNPIALPEGVYAGPENNAVMTFATL